MESKQDKVKLISAWVSGAVVLLLYLIFIWRFLESANLQSLSQLEVLIASTQFLRMGILFAIRRKYDQPVVPIIVFSIEPLTIPALLLGYFITQDQSYLSFMASLLTAWIGATAVIASPYTIYSFMKAMLSPKSNLRGVLPVAVLEFGTFVLLASALYGSTTTISGFDGLGKYLILSVGQSVVQSGVSTSPSDILLSTLSAIFFVSMLVYSSIGTHTMLNRPKFVFSIIPVFISTIFMLLWVNFGLFFLKDLFTLLLVPTILMALLAWVVARGKKD